MRRIVTALASALAVALAVPGVALAHHGAHHKHHKGHHAKGARVVRFGSAEGGKSAAETGSSAAEDIGTVVSYEKEVLTIKLADGSSLSGKVTAQTRVICLPSTPPEGGSDGSGSGSDTGSGSGGQGHSWGRWRHHDNSCAEPSAEEGKAGPASSGGWAGAHGDCLQGSGAEVDLEKVLVAGAIVREAELRLTPAGSVWESVAISQ